MPNMARCGASLFFPTSVANAQPKATTSHNSTTDASTNYTPSVDASTNYTPSVDASTSCIQLIHASTSYCRTVDAATGCSKLVDASTSSDKLGAQFGSEYMSDSPGLQSMFKGGTSLFRDQIYTLTQWFGQWTECEQTVALYTLLRQLDAKQARFIEHLLQEQASTDTSVDSIENLANNIEFVRSLDSVKWTKEELTQQLLKHFPLLHPGNDNVKNEYLKVIPKALSNSVENGTKVEDCRKLLTYTLIHPAVSNEERSHFTKWLGQLEQQYSKKITQTQLTHSNIQNLSSYAEQIRLDSDSTHPQGSDLFTDVEVSNHHLPLHATNSAPPYGSGNVSLFPNNNNHRKLSRTRSYANHQAVQRKGSGEICQRTGGSNSNQWRSQTPNNSGEISTWMGKAQESVSPAHSDHGALSPQSSLSSTDSDHEHSKTGVFYQDNSGMKEFPGWLKGLRLHKYSPLFKNVAYEDMLQVDEKWLEERKVTKGARNKLAQSISKLRERTTELRAMEENVMQGTNLRQVLTDLKAIVYSPIKPYFPPEGVNTSPEISDADLPGLINRLMGRLCTQLLVNSKIEDDCYPAYIHLIDKCMHHEAFTIKQRKLLQEWRSQVLQRNNGRMITGRQDQRIPCHRPTKVYRRAIIRSRKLVVMCRTNSWNPARRGSTSKGNVVYAQRAIQGQVPWYNGYDKKPLTLTYSGPDHLNLPHPSHMNKTQVTSTTTRSAIHRTQSAPLRPHQPLMRRNVATEPEINERLDSLARSMTEAALSSQDSVEHGDGNDVTSVA